MAIGGQRYGPFYAALPGAQTDLTRHGQLTELDSLIGLCQEVRMNPQSPIVWEFGVIADGAKQKYAPVFLTTEFCVRVERVLAQIGPIGAGAALRRFRQISFWQPKTGFLIEESRAPEPSAETRRKYSRLVGKIGNYLAGVRDSEFLGKEPSVNYPRGSLIAAKATHRKEKSGRDRDLKQTPYFSPTDDQRYKRIGQDQIAKYTNPELWKRWGKEEKRLGVDWQGFRHSLNRIRVHYKLPSSNDLHKK